MTAHLKTPFAPAMHSFADGKVNDGLQIAKREWPCRVVSVSGAFVTVAFEIQGAPQTLPQVTMPVAASRYAREPIQVGDVGVAQAADASLAGISGTGGTATLAQPANLAALVFQPTSSAAFPAVADGNSYTITGVGASGVTLQSGDMSVTLTLTASGIAINLNGNNLTVVNGDIFADAIGLKPHHHEAPNGATGPALP